MKLTTKLVTLTDDVPVRNERVGNRDGSYIRCPKRVSLRTHCDDFEFIFEAEFKRIEIKANLLGSAARSREEMTILDYKVVTSRKIYTSRGLDAMYRMWTVFYDEGKTSPNDPLLLRDARICFAKMLEEQSNSAQISKTSNLPRAIMDSTEYYMPYSESGFTGGVMTRAVERVVHDFTFIYKRVMEGVEKMFPEAEEKQVHRRIEL